MDEETLKKLAALKARQQTEGLYDPQTQAAMRSDPRLGQRALDFLLGEYGPTESMPSPSKPEPGLSTDMGMINPFDWASSAAGSAVASKMTPRISGLLSKQGAAKTALAQKAEETAGKAIGKEAVDKPHFLFTTENPKYPEAISSTLKKVSNQDIINSLKEQGMEAIPVKGKYGTPENSIAVLNVNPEQAEGLHKLAADLGQESSIYSHAGRHEMRYHGGENAGKSHYGLGTEFHKTPPEDYYSTLPSGETFTHNFDFENIRPQGEIQKTRAFMAEKQPQPYLSKSAEMETEGTKPIMQEGPTAEEARKTSKVMDKEALEKDLEHYENPENWQSTDDVFHRQLLLKKYREHFPEEAFKKYGTPLSYEEPITKSRFKEPEKSTGIKKLFQKQKPTGFEQEDVVKNIDLDQYRRMREEEENKVLSRLKKLLKR